MIIRGQKINDRYEIIRTIGEGGMANVYLAYDTILNREVAVKVLRGDLADDEKFVRRFQREAIAASSLSHPNIVEMYDVGEDNGKYFIVMEYVDGITLKSLIKKRGCMSLVETIDIMLQLTSGIACAHDSYIIHRDIKPQNVLILDDGTAKITDFGIAMALNSNELTQTNSIMGSVHYLPPEQANGKGSTIKSDIYSLGILMYEMLVGKVPFKGDNAVEIAMKQLTEPIPSVRKINENIPQSIENIILKATAKNPKNRYDSVNEMHEELKVALSDEHANDERVSYKYPEQELEETKVMKKEDLMPEKPKKKISKTDKVLNILLWITGGICVLLAVGIMLAVIIFPKKTEVKDVILPNIANLTVAEAESTLIDAGFYISSTTEEKYNNDIPEGKVIGVKNYNAGEVIKAGKTLIIMVSKGTNEITVENYVGQKYQEVQVALERDGLQVFIEYEPISDEKNFKEDVIVKQSVGEGTKLTEGDIIRLYINTLQELYPDFVNGNYTLSSIEDFASVKGLDLEFKYEETSEHSAGSVIKQNPTAGYVLKKGQKLVITVAQAPQVIDTTNTSSTSESDEVDNES